MAVRLPSAKAINAGTRQRLKADKSKPGAAGIPDILEPAVTWQPVGSLQTARRNPRVHSRRQVRLLADAIERFGFAVPLLVDEHNRILAGHGRLEAAQRLGMEQVPTLRLKGLSAAEKRAFALADNRLAEFAGWDKEALKLEFEALIDLGIDLEITGFSTGEADLIINSGTAQQDEDDVVDDVRAPTPTTRVGDLWQLGPHHLLCGDALEPASYVALMQGQKAAAVFTDPPYNVRVGGFVSGLGKVRHREFAMASGEMSAAEYTQFLTDGFTRMAGHCRRAALVYCCMDWRHLREALAAGHAVFGSLRNLCVWTKTNAGMGSLYRSQHELILVYQNGPGRAVNNVELGIHGRHRSNVWPYAGMNSFRKGRDAELALHPTMKPVALVADALRDCTRHGELVLDPFGGGGTTLVAAHRTGRVARLVELDPVYVEVTISRWQKISGHTARLAATGQTIEELRSARSALPNRRR